MKRFEKREASRIGRKAGRGQREGGKRIFF